MSKLIFEAKVKANMEPAAAVIKEMQEAIDAATAKGCSSIKANLYHFAHADEWAAPDHYIKILGYK